MSAEKPMLRVAILVGSESPSTIDAIRAVCTLPRVECAAILLDTHRSSWKIRLRNLRKNIRRNGISYPFRRLLGAIRHVVERQAEAIVPQAEVDALLREAFPDRDFSFADLSKRFSMPVLEVGSLNSTFAAAKLAELSVDLGVVLGTRVLKRSTFAQPRLGCINLHKGKVPEYRGMPPGFWELWDGADTAGVTVHFVDDGLDTGDIVETATVEISQFDSEETLLWKLSDASIRTLGNAVASIARGEFKRQPQPQAEYKARSSPTFLQRRQLANRLGVSEQNDVVFILKHLNYLILFYSGLYSFVRLVRRSFGYRATILLYHRVNDWSSDPLTVSLQRFAQHLIVLHKYYNPVRTADLVDMLRGEGTCPPGSVAIHFDDCYRDVYQNGMPLLKASSTPACFFVNPGYLGTDRRFLHDSRRYPLRYPNLTREELCDWHQQGFELGAHTVNHVDLGVLQGEASRIEVMESKNLLEQTVRAPVLLFSFPYGRPDNITAENARYVREGGFQAMFSAFGGFVSKRTDQFYIPRVGASGLNLPIRLLMDIEGLTPENIRLMMKARLSGRPILQTK
ncbi:MAG: formyltransferase family protein [Bryobacterales bacterium]|nr:formyltransferase family protein [Bryobacterales bacterium]